MIFANCNCNPWLQCFKGSERYSWEPVVSNQQHAFRESPHVFRFTSRERCILHLHCLHYVPSSHGAYASEICYLFHPWMWIYHRIFLRTSWPTESARTHDIHGGILYIILYSVSQALNPKRSDFFPLFLILVCFTSPEASVNHRFHCHHGWYHLRIHGSPQLHSLGAFLCLTGTTFSSFNP